LKQSELRIIPSSLRYKSAPSTDQKILVSIDNTSELTTEFDRIRTLSLAEIYDNERQSCTVYRPTFQVNYLYDNSYIGTTQYSPFLNNLYYYNAEEGYNNQSWSGTPQFYEFDFYRPDVQDNHLTYYSKSAYSYNWSFYFSYAYENDYNALMNFENNNFAYVWTANEGIPFVIRNIEINGDPLISFECISPHGLSPSEIAYLNIRYNGNRFFEVYSVGNDKYKSEENVFNIYNLGYTGTTFRDGRVGTFKRIIYPDSTGETMSKYYVRKHKIISNPEDVIITKTGFQNNPFNDAKEIYLSSITPDLKTRVAKQSNSFSYTITSRDDYDLNNIVDNQKRPVTELFLTIINKGYSGYFNKPYINSGLKQGWFFNITEKINGWWANNNSNSDTNILTNSYVKVDNSGFTRTFYYNQDLKVGDYVYGDFCEWNDYEQKERVISNYYQKLKYNEDIFQISLNPNTQNTDGFYYKTHSPMTLRTYSSYVESADASKVEQVPFYSFYSESNQEFRWRDLYSFGFKDETGRGVDYPFLNKSHYPFENIIFRVFAEGNNSNNTIDGINANVQPKIDECE
jgi:hypothetical protein